MQSLGCAAAKSRNAAELYFQSCATHSLACRAIAFLIDGYSTLLHHFSTSFTLVALMLHMFPRDRALTAACVVPIMQHMFILVKYHAHTTYLILELVLEGWFQWEVRHMRSTRHLRYLSCFRVLSGSPPHNTAPHTGALSNVRHTVVAVHTPIQVLSNVSAFHSHFGLDITRIGRGMALTMLVAHWGYLSGSVLHMLDGYFSAKEDAEAAAAEAGDDLTEGSVTGGRTLARHSTMNQFLSASEVVHKGKSKLKEVKHAGHQNKGTLHGAAYSAMEVARKAALAAVEMAETAVDTVSTVATTAADKAGVTYAVDKVEEGVTYASSLYDSSASMKTLPINSPASPDADTRDGSAHSVDNDRRV